MGRKFFIHIGAMKAASSWFQRAMRQTPGVATFGPKDFDPGLGEIWYEPPGRVSARLARRLGDQIERFMGASTADAVVISNERFLKGETAAGVYFDTLETIADVFSRLSVPVTVLAFSRAPIDWVPSIYQQFIKSNQYSRPFRNFARPDNEAVRGPLSLEIIEHIFKDRLGAGGFHWFPSESFRSDPQLGLSCIEERAGLRLALPKRLSNDVNPSIDPIEIEAIRTLNRLKDAYVRSARKTSADRERARETFDPVVRQFVRFAMERRGPHHDALRRALGRRGFSEPPFRFTIEPNALAELESLGAAVVAREHYGPWRERYQQATLTP